MTDDKDSLSAYVDRLRAGEPPNFPADADSAAFARRLDSQDKLRHLRDEFLLPTKGSLRKRALDGSLPPQQKSAISSPNGHTTSSPSPTTTTTTTTTTNSQANNQHHIDNVKPQDTSSSDDNDDNNEQAIYFVGNSLGAQPRAVRRYIDAQLETWACVGVNGHFTTMQGSPLVQWQDMADSCARASAAIVGCAPHEVVIMNTLTANLHMLMASFYRPSGRRHKIILEWKPFPSDHYAIESQIRWHGLDPTTSMVKLSPTEPGSSALLSTEQILAVIDKHADETALLLLPGIQYYSGQLFDMATITAHARARGIVVGWDLAHAVGNVELRLHDWDVDFACWCTYKYLNAGPGAIAGAFVHERHGGVEWPSSSPSGPKKGAPSYRPRLAGWYGGDKVVRFNMDNLFVPTPGAAGYQVSNPSAIDLASLSAALSVFSQTTMHDLRSKALVLTAYAEHLLNAMLSRSNDQQNQNQQNHEEEKQQQPPLFRQLTPTDPSARGSQLSLMLREERLLDDVARALETHGVACDKRKPGVIRIAPVPLYCSFEDVWRFMQIFGKALGV